VNSQEYPALFLDADGGSNRYQANFLRLVRGEYATLLLAAAFSMVTSQAAIVHILYAAVFFVGLLILVTRAQSKPEQSWYRCRALAESVKTLTWRYMMHATPFNDGDAVAKSRFRDELHEMFLQNQETAKQITSDWSGNNQITEKMTQVRALNLANRKEHYLKNRVDDQRSWYSSKAKLNRKSANFWFYVSGIAYVLAGGMVLARIGSPSFQLWPIEPLIVVASVIVGWMQIKKFNELSAAYTVVAHEIGLIRPKADQARNEVQFSEFVNDAEKAFSREHTLWIARQSD
jgi:SMODS and SLOG-associating 2TM effector domain 3/SMODS and SLOG-associating 2TM effector domain 1